VLCQLQNQRHVQSARYDSAACAVLRLAALLLRHDIGDPWEMIARPVQRDSDASIS